MNNTKIGFIGLGNVGGKLAGNLARNDINLAIRDLNSDLEAPLIAMGATRAASPLDMMRSVDVVITCLPSPAASARVLEAPDGILAGLRPGQIWLEMSTTDSAEVQRLGALVEAQGGMAPGSGAPDFSTARAGWQSRTIKTVSPWTGHSAERCVTRRL